MWTGTHQMEQDPADKDKRKDMGGVEVGRVKSV